MMWPVIVYASAAVKLCSDRRCFFSRRTRLALTAFFAFVFISCAAYCTQLPTRRSVLASEVSARQLMYIRIESARSFVPRNGIWRGVVTAEMHRAKKTCEKGSSSVPRPRVHMCRACAFATRYASSVALIRLDRMLSHASCRVTGCAHSELSVVLTVVVTQTSSGSPLRHFDDVLPPGSGG